MSADATKRANRAAAAKIGRLRNELSATREHWEDDYIEEAMSSLRAAAVETNAWEGKAWVSVAAVAGTSSTHAEWCLLAGQERGWYLLEQSVRYWTWVISTYPGKFFLGDAAMAMVKAIWLGRVEWSNLLAQHVERSVVLQADARDHLLWVDLHLDFARFALWICDRACNESQAAEKIEDEPWRLVRVQFEAGHVERALLDACEEHLRLSSDAVGFSPVPRGNRLLAPEIRCLAEKSKRAGYSVEPSLHPLLGLSIARPKVTGYDEKNDPVMNVIASRSRGELA